MEELLKLAKEYATYKHGDQQYGKYPYYYHLNEVEGTLLKFGINDFDLRMAAWLHDVIEDCADLTMLEHSDDAKKSENYNYVNQQRMILEDDIASKFGRRVSEVVSCVTQECGKNRKERYALTYPKIFKNEDALLIKLADRIANTESSKIYMSKLGEGKIFLMYKKEYSDFKKALYHPYYHSKTKGIVLEHMWNHLDALYS